MQYLETLDQGILMHNKKKEIMSTFNFLNDDQYFVAADNLVI